MIQKIIDAVKNFEIGGIPVKWIDWPLCIGWAVIFALPVSAIIIAILSVFGVIDQTIPDCIQDCHRTCREIV